MINGNVVLLKKKMQMSLHLYRLHETCFSHLNWNERRMLDLAWYDCIKSTRPLSRASSCTRSIEIKFNL